jgi:hypothetical protein
VESLPHLSIQSQVSESQRPSHLQKGSESIKFIPYELGWLDKASVMLEEKLNTKIDWWPFNPPVREPLENDAEFFKMTWTCVYALQFNV